MKKFVFFMDELMFVFCILAMFYQFLLDDLSMIIYYGILAIINLLCLLINK